MENEKKLFKSLLSDEKYKLEINKLISRPLKNGIMKNNDISAELNKGSDLYKEEQHSAEEHEFIFQCYCASIAWALPESRELAYGYGNRSEFLFHIEKYTECIKDIDRALKLITEDSFKVKLLCRKVQSLKKLGSSEFCDILVKAKDIFNKIPESHKTRETLIEIINKTEKVVTMVDEMSSISSLHIKKDEKLMVDEDQRIIFDSVTIKYNEKYGRYLVAKRDIQPGEIVFEENLYASFLISRKRHTNCNHCLSTCLTLIPCNNCNWAMYCSESCKSKANKSYHKIECHLIPKILSRFNENESIVIDSQLPIRLLLKGIEEASSITKLKLQLKEIDFALEKVTSEIAGEYFNENMEANFTSVYTLKSHTNADSHQDPFIVMVAIKLIRTLLEDTKFLKVDDILKNDDAVFIGSLFIKLWKIKNANSYVIFKPTDTCDHLDAEEDIHKNHYCNATGCGLPIISCLINHSCIPNVAKIVTDNQKLIIYALQPIKEGSQIFDCYQVPFYSQPKAERINDLQQYQFKCDCDACKNDWPAYNVDEMNDSLTKLLMETEKDETLNKQILEIKELIFTQDVIKVCHFGEIRKDLRKCIIKVLKHAPLNSKEACKLYIMLQGLFMRVFSISKIEFYGCKSDE